MRSRITDVPYPEALGLVAGGPPVSLHSSTSLRLKLPLRCLRHRTDTWPLLLDRAPYLAALVASSWSTIETACVASGTTTISGPATDVLPSFMQGASSARTSSARLTPCQRLWLKSACALAR